MLWQTRSSRNAYLFAKLMKRKQEATKSLEARYSAFIKVGPISHPPKTSVAEKSVTPKTAQIELTFPSGIYILFSGHIKTENILICLKNWELCYFSYKVQIKHKFATIKVKKMTAHVFTII